MFENNGGRSLLIYLYINVAMKKEFNLKMSSILSLEKSGSVWARYGDEEIILTIRFCKRKIRFKFEG